VIYDLLTGSEFQQPDTLSEYLTRTGLDSCAKLAGQMAQIFDRYTNYRPELILGWERERSDDWQGLLWRAVVDRVGDLDELIASEVALLSDKSPAVLGMTAALMHEQCEAKWGARIRVLEQAYLRDLLPHPDAAEGIAAFVEKRVAQWR